MDEEFWQGIATRIAEARESVGYKQAQLGEAIGRSSGVIGNYERGERRPSFRELREIAEVTNKDLRWLIFGAPYQDQLDRIETKLDHLLAQVNGLPEDAGLPEPPGELGRRARGSSPTPQTVQRTSKKRAAGGV